MKPPQNSRIAVAEVSTYRWSFEDDVIKYRRQGFEAIGVWRYKLNEYGEDKAVELLRENQMRVSSLHWAGGFTGSDGRSYRDAMLDAFEAIEQASLLEAGCLVIMAGSRGGHTKKHCRRMVIDALHEMCEAAQASRVELAIEPMHLGCAYDWTFLTDLPATLDIVAEMNSPNLGVVLDCYHLAHDPVLLEWLPHMIDHVQLVQLGDARSAPLGEQNRCLLGEGTLPLAQIISRLETLGYEGDYEIELQGEAVEHIAYEEVLERSMNTMRNWVC